MAVELKEVYALSFIYISNKLNDKTNNTMFTLNLSDEPSPPPLLSVFEL